MSQDVRSCMPTRCTSYLELPLNRLQIDIHVGRQSIETFLVCLHLLEGKSSQCCPYFCIPLILRGENNRATCCVLVELRYVGARRVFRVLREFRGDPLHVYRLGFALIRAQPTAFLQVDGFHRPLLPFQAGPDNCPLPASWFTAPSSNITLMKLCLMALQVVLFL